MAPENNHPAPENHLKNPKTTPQDQPPLKCPRCDSLNTKFCYYNNYNLNQPRHFCKNCRRYWTRGGALRNVPVGGGCRKAKRLKTNSATTSSKVSYSGIGSTSGVYTQFLTSSLPTLPDYGCGLGTGDDLVGPGSVSYPGLDLLGLNYSVQQHNMVSSIESLSSINQEMHWKLQQQRLGMVYENVDQEKLANNGGHEGGINLFKNLEINDNCSSNNNDNNDVVGKMNVGPTEWLFDQIQTSCGGNNNSFY